MVVFKQGGPHKVLQAVVIDTNGDINALTYQLVNNFSKVATKGEEENLSVFFKWKMVLIFY